MTAAQQAAVDIGAVDEFPVGEFRILAFGRREIGIVQLADGSFRAVRNVCPHAGAPLCRGRVTGTMVDSAPGQLSFAADKFVVRCPWHAWEFDLESGDVFATARRERVRVYDVSCVRGRVLLQLGRSERAEGSE